eukprot:561999-Amphidinium_carterae.1
MSTLDRDRVKRSESCLLSGGGSDARKEVRKDNYITLFRTWNSAAKSIWGPPAEAEGGGVNYR